MVINFSKPYRRRRRVVSASNRSANVSCRRTGQPPHAVNVRVPVAPTVAAGLVNVSVVTVPLRWHRPGLAASMPLNVEMTTAAFVGADSVDV